MKITELFPKVISKSEFHLSKVKFLPDTFGCYVITTFFNDILYIGQTNNLRIRIKQHLDSSKKTKISELGKGFFFYFNIVDRQVDLSKLERGWLYQFELAEGKLPIFNSIRSPSK